MPAKDEIESDCHYKELENKKDTSEESTNNGPEKKITQSVLFALLAGLWFATGNYIIGQGSALGFIALYAANVGNLVFAVIYYLYYALVRLYKNEHIWTWKESNYRHPEGGLNNFNILMLALYTLANIVAYTLVVFWFKFALTAEINQGIITSIFGLVSFFSAVGAYIVFKEKLKRSYLIGMIFMIICVLCIALSSSNKSIEPDKNNIDSILPDFVDGQNAPLTTIPMNTSSYQNNTEFVILAIVFGILCPISFCMASLVVLTASRGPKLKPGAKFNKIDSTDLTVWNYVTTNIIFVLCSIIQFQVGSHPFDPAEYFQISAGGFICALGVVVLNYALVIGYVGPVFAISTVQVIFQAVLDIIFLGQLPNIVQIIGSLFGIAGAITMTLF